MVAYRPSPSAAFVASNTLFRATETVTDPAQLAAGSHAGSSPPLSFPSPGTRYVFAVLDPSDAVSETDETNNVAEAPGTVAVTGSMVVDNADPGYSEQETAGWWF